jgi:thiamine biosynthesis lipoprotein
MKKIEHIMGMPITLEIVDSVIEEILEEDAKIVFDYFRHVDEKFSKFKKESELNKINRKEISENEFSPEMLEVLELSEETKLLTNGYFDIKFGSEECDTSGLVKGWAIFNAAKVLWRRGRKNFFVDAGSDIQFSGVNSEGKMWSIGIRNPFKIEEVVKILRLTDMGVATSGTYARGQHIYNPKNLGTPITDIVSLTVIGPNIYEADRFATAAFAMGAEGINFIENLKGFEGYQISKDGIATMTSNFGEYLK